MSMEVEPDSDVWDTLNKLMRTPCRNKKKATKTPLPNIGKEISLRGLFDNNVDNKKIRYIFGF
ncbi:hypothetical protein MTBBW1_50025 [Desulfamplus magnetovallimortis]|uniref:Uncharacterized protein n=1 Tax=Desulfamplus magnetovallimortis TaxID=1246637 RepID=A0A1W1HHQ0_9BACT|nr:hypothetical protein MTBBW1_50025 [Desulfamplus magnetovallimortis]